MALAPLFRFTGRCLHRLHNGDKLPVSLAPDLSDGANKLALGQAFAAYAMCSSAGARFSSANDRSKRAPSPREHTLGRVWHLRRHVASNRERPGVFKHDDDRFRADPLPGERRPIVNGAEQLQIQTSRANELCLQ